MFQPSPQCLFRPLKSLAHFKIHHQLPLNPRESKQLLNLLTTSFRQQLDQEHGSLVSEGESGSRPKVQFTSSIPAKRRRPSTSATSQAVARPTDVHLHSILTNPLFTYGPRSTKAQDGRRDPMDIFDEACARGFMKMEYAVGCLKAKKRSITESSVPSIRAGMKESGAGLKVLKWLSSNDLINNSMFLENPELSYLLVEFLVAEDLHEAVWMWIGKALREITLKDPKWRVQPAAEVAVQLLTPLIKTQALLDSISLDTAYLSLARAKKMLDELHCPTQPILSRAGCFLSYQSSVNSSLHIPPSESSYDLFLELIPAFTPRETMHRAHLSLHHPSRPEARPALSYLKAIKLDLWKSNLIDRSKNFDMACDGRRGWRIIAIGLDAAKFLLERDQYVDAKWVMDFLQSTYSQELGLGSRHKHEFEQAKAEAESLELLQSLNLA